MRGSEVDLAMLVVRPISDQERDGWQFYMRRYHYLGSRVIVGEHLLCAAYLENSLVALLG